MNKKLKRWYQAKYDDAMSGEMNGKTTFRDLLEELLTYREVDQVIGLNDELIRFRLFKELARLLKVDESVILKRYKVIVNK